MKRTVLAVSAIALAISAVALPAQAGKKDRVCVEITISKPDWDWMRDDSRFHRRWYMGNRAGNGVPKNKFRTQVYNTRTAKVCRERGHPTLILDMRTFRGPDGGLYIAKFED